jgi:hypothetical protein
MPKFIMVHDLPADPNNPNGPTIKEENLKQQHNIPVGSLVEVKYANWHRDGCCIKVHVRLWVFNHSRDCDGTPLYTLASKTKEQFENLCVEMNIDQNNFFARREVLDVLESGFSEDRLKVIEVTENLKKGYDALEWADEEE